MSAPAAHPKPVQEEEPASKRAKGAAGTAVAASSTAAAAAAAAFVHPDDWPKAGPINLPVADLPHDSADTEVGAQQPPQRSGQQSGGPALRTCCPSRRRDGVLT
jgi:hypothetical protein